MGQYLQGGICYKICISKEAIERQNISYDAVLEGLSKKVDLDLYDITEIDMGYNFTLKEELFKKEEFIGFLKEQYKLLGVKEDRTLKIISKLETLNTFQEIIELANEKCHENFQYADIVEPIYCGVWKKSVRVRYELILFMVEGKIFMECYSDFLRYLENLIKKDNIYPISKAISLFIQ